MLATELERIMGWNPNTDADTDQASLASHLFLVRLWLEDLGADQQEWRGRVQHILSGQVRYFRAWAALEMILRQMVFLLVSDRTADVNDSSPSSAKDCDKPVL